MRGVRGWKGWHRVTWLAPAGSFLVSAVLVMPHSVPVAMMLGLLGCCLLVIGALV